MNSIKQKVKDIIGAKVNKVSVGKSTGSIICLYFSENIDKTEFNLMIYSAWRLDCNKSKAVVTGWNESNNPQTGNLAIQIRKIKNDIVNNFVINDFGDIELHFESKKVLKVFCDYTPKVEDIDLNVHCETANPHCENTNFHCKNSNMHHPVFHFNLTRYIIQS